MRLIDADGTEFDVAEGRVDRALPLRRSQTKPFCDRTHRSRLRGRRARRRRRRGLAVHRRAQRGPMAPRTVFLCTDCAHRARGGTAMPGLWRLEHARRGSPAPAVARRRAGAPARAARAGSPTSRRQRGAAVTGIGELDRVLGGGLVPGSLVLLGGSPGHRQVDADAMALGKLAAGGRTRAVRQRRGVGGADPAARRAARARPRSRCRRGRDRARRGARAARGGAARRCASSTRCRRCTPRS